MRVIEWSLEYEGCDHEQYFRGVGIALTEWDAVFNGVGNTPLEAANDALEQAAMSGCEGIPEQDFQPSAEWPDDPEPIPDGEEGEGMHHYAAIYVRFAEDSVNP